MGIAIWSELKVYYGLINCFPRGYCSKWYSFFNASINFVALTSKRRWNVILVFQSCCLVAHRFANSCNFSGDVLYNRVPGVDGCVIVYGSGPDELAMMRGTFFTSRKVTRNFLVSSLRYAFRSATASRRWRSVSYRVKRRTSSLSLKYLRLPEFFNCCMVEVV